MSRFLHRRRVLSLGLLPFVSWLPPAMAQPAATDATQALHLLNRLGYGPRPGDVERVVQMGAQRYIEEQLHPERLALPSTLDQRLQAHDTTRLSQRELIQRFREAKRAGKGDGEDGNAMRRELVQSVSQQAVEARLLRALYSPRQLEEVMVDFWFNHFNVFSGKGLDRVLVGVYEREAIRPFVLGRFRDLLGATAHHPAMLFYLDNWLSTAPGTPAHGGGQGGLNENYARELMELHTLGVDAGYTQQDVTALARMLTGWTFDPRIRSGSSIFRFDPRRHDGGSKRWLGQAVEARGQAEGEWALDVLARHPSTARHLGLKLARFFVSDQPPQALVDRLARRFSETDGDIRAVLAALFSSAEFLAPSVRGVKFKTPYEFALSALRAADVPVAEAHQIQKQLQQLGMPLYGCPTPDGYAHVESAWLNPDAMTRRVNLATVVGSGRWPPPAEGSGGRADGRPLDAQALLATLGPAISPGTRQAALESAPALRAALLLGSPDFMRR